MSPTDNLPSCDGPESAGVAHINTFGQEHFGGVLHCQWTNKKGRILHATREWAEGEIILVESPLHIVQEDESGAFQHIQQLCKDRPDDFDYDPLWYWCALQSLTEEEVKKAKKGGWKGTTPAIQRNLLLLHHDEICEASSSSEILAQELLPGICPILIERLTQIWVLNCFEYSDSPQGYSTYFFSSFMSHSCYPNAVWHYTGTDHVLRARRPISVGDEVCISYLPEHGLMQSSPVRRLELHDTKRFWCECERCVGEFDLSRGLQCPNCETGTVFARTPDLGPAKDDTLLPAQLMGVSCEDCGKGVGKREATRLAGNEKRLKGIVDDLAGRSPSSVSVSELQRVEGFINSNFKQHALADLAWEHMAECYAIHQKYADQRRLLECRCTFHEKAYPGLNGSHAWALEAQGDAMLRAAAKGRPGRGGKRVWQVKEDPQQALVLYGQALDILTKMFGEEHEYVTHVERKKQSAEKALAAAQEAVNNALGA